MDKPSVGSVYHCTYKGAQCIFKVKDVDGFLDGFNVYVYYNEIYDGALGLISMTISEWRSLQPGMRTMSARDVELLEILYG